MKKLLIPISAIFLLGLASCKKYLDINKDPDRIAEASAPINLLLTNATVNTGFASGSDLNRYGGLLVQQYSGQTTGGETQTQQYEKYLLQSSDVNNMWNLFYATTLNDIEVIIRLATAQNAPYYRGVAKLLKAYNYQHLVDAYGNIPFSETQQTSLNTSPKYDDGAAIYPALITMIDEALADLNTASTGAIEPGTNSTIYSGSFSTKKANWIKFGNTLKLRLLIHSSKLNLPETVTKITALVNQAGVSFFAANADNFEMPYFNLQNRQNPIHQFDLSRANYLFPNKFLVDAMNSKLDPRRPFFFSAFPFGSTTYAGAAAGDPLSQKYSRIHSYLRGAATGGTANADGSTNANPLTGSITYDGTAPIRMLTFAEYNFIRAEAAVYGAPGDAQTFFQAGITASMQNAGVAAVDIAAYLALNGTLTGTNANKVSQIISEKFVANFGVMQESWTDWRRTGYPAIVKVANAVTTDIPRSLPYPQGEIDANKNAPPQKPNLLVRVFWDKP